MDGKSHTEDIGQKPRGLLPESPDFLDFVQTGSIFVDKTSKILDLLNSSPTRTFFLSRPRRFGKTLLLDTIQNIAKGDRTLFDGMDIGKDGSGYAWETYPVIRMTFSGFPSDPIKAENLLLRTLDEISIEHNLELPRAETPADIQFIISKLSRNHHGSRLPNFPKGSDQEPANVVFLIDEYDFPLLDSIDDPKKAEGIRKMLRNFYSALKNSRKMLRFTFITGITKFSGLSIFSGMNNAMDITLNPNYAQICGFTKDEITSNFTSHIESALRDMKENGILPLNSTYATFMDELEFWYNGYS
ncbi:MAG: AAA family ATPase, partial [Deltaproteobacteria bacterium]|nr:AAA family ATPase [Deltaproteobacteria bacterium]